LNNTFKWSLQPTQYIRLLSVSKGITYALKFDLNKIGSICIVDVITGDVTEKKKLNGPNSADGAVGFNVVDNDIIALLRVGDTIQSYYVDATTFDIKNTVTLKLNTTLPSLAEVMAFIRYQTSQFYYMLYSMTNNSMTDTYFAIVNPQNGQVNTMFNVPVYSYYVAGADVDEDKKRLYINQLYNYGLLTVDISNGLLVSNVIPDLHTCLGRNCRMSQIALNN